MRTTAAPALLTLVLLVGTAGCTAESPDDADQTSEPTSAAPDEPSPSGPTRSTTPDASTSPDPASSSEPSASPFKADTRPDDGGHGSGNGLGVTGVRAAQHPGYDRVVFDLGGRGTPGWRVEYVARPRAEGSGKPVRLKGTAFLQVVLRGVGLPFDTGIEPYGDSSTRVPGTGTKGVAEIAPGGVFEGEQQAFIGLTGTKRPFRAFALTDPARVVIDVRAPTEPVV
jgi:hypothetical protein